MQELAALLPRLTPERLGSFLAEVKKRQTDRGGSKLVRKLLQSAGPEALAEALADLRPPAPAIAPQARAPRIRHSPIEPDGGL